MAISYLHSLILLFCGDRTRSLVWVLGFIAAKSKDADDNFTGMEKPTLSKIRTLRELGVDKANRRDFLQGTGVEFQFPTLGGDDVFGLVKLGKNRLQSTIFTIKNESGTGARAFFKFRDLSLEIARKFGASELELRGMAINNPNIKSMLKRKGFVSQTIPIPDVFGGNGNIEVLTKVFPIK